MSEPLLVKRVSDGLQRDFDILYEVSGVHPIYQDRVRVDMMLRAKPHLVAAGFTEDWFGVECKWSATIEGATSKMTRMVWQSITYAQSVFSVVNAQITPSFVAVYTPDDLPDIIETRLACLLGLGLYGNVGRLYFYQDGSWGIKFAWIYARSSNGSYHVNRSQLPKRRVGSV